MMKTESMGSLSITTRSVAELSRDFKPGAVVRLTVLSASPDGTLKVNIAGRTYIAAGMRDMRVGQTFDARIRYSDNAVFLVPLNSHANEIRPDLFAALGVRETPVSALLVSFFGGISARLVPEQLRFIMKVSSRFPGKESRAAEAAAILSERGIEVNDETVERLIAIMEGQGAADSDQLSNGDPGSSSSYAREFCAFVNHKVGQSLHWIIAPFRREIGGEECSGSVRFLIDIETGRTVECRVTFIEPQHCWEFSISDGTCTFTSKPGFPSVVFDEFVVYLKNQLTKAGIFGVEWYDPASDPAPAIKSIDLEI